MPTFDFDLFVVGGGSGGVRAARLAAERGARVALAECGPLGGTCVNAGCIPKKLYAIAAHYAHAFEEAPGFGWTATQAPRLDWAMLKQRRAGEVARLNGVYARLLASAGVELVAGRARLADPHTVTVGDRRFTAANLLVATGGAPWVPEVPWRDLLLTSDGMFDLPTVPRRLLVVGGGYIACEFASIFHGLGAEVMLVHRGPGILRGFDDDVRRFLAAEMAAAGIDLRLGVGMERIAAEGPVRRVTLTDGSEAMADVVLYATGRRPNTHGLGLEAAGVALSDSGAIRVDEWFRTSTPSVHAIGDVIDQVQLTPVALAQAHVVVDLLFGKGARHVDHEGVPTAVFTHPGVATVGLTEAQARERFGQVEIYRSTFRALKHTLSARPTRTLMKLVVDAASDRVVGLHMVGEDAGEVVQGFAVAMQAGATKSDFDRTLGIHPTAAEEFVTMSAPVSGPWVPG